MRAESKHKTTHGSGSKGEVLRCLGGITACGGERAAEEVVQGRGGQEGD